MVQGCALKYPRWKMGAYSRIMCSKPGGGFVGQLTCYCCKDYLELRRGCRNLWKCHSCFLLKSINVSAKTQPLILFPSEYFRVQIRDREIKVNIFDMAGHPFFFEVRTPLQKTQIHQQTKAKQQGSGEHCSPSAQDAEADGAL